MIIAPNKIKKSSLISFNIHCIFVLSIDQKNVF